MIVKPKNWIKFQHYKDRCPPWIKLHKSILDDYDFHILQDASKSLAMCLWLVASEHLDGEIDADSTKLAFRFRTTADKIEKALKPLIEGGFFFVVQCASNALAERNQDAPLDRGETETETEVTVTKHSRKKIKSQIPNDLIISDGIRDWAAKNGYSKIDERFEHFVGACKAKAYEYADWDAAFRNAIVGDWAKLGKQNTTSIKPFDMDEFLRSK